VLSNGFSLKTGKSMRLYSVVCSFAVELLLKVLSVLSMFSKSLTMSFRMHENQLKQESRRIYLKMYVN